MNITANIDEFLIIYPNFNTLEIKPIATFYFNDTVAWAKTQWDLRRFGARLNNAIYLLTAHRVYLNIQSRTGQAGQGGKVASATVDGVSVSYTQMPSTDNFNYWLSLSPYGIELAALLDTLSPVPSYIGGSFERVF